MSRTRQQLAIVRRRIWKLLLGGLAVAACGTEDPTASPALARARTAIDDHTVTLITGDRVTLHGDAPVVTPAPGRGPSEFAIQRDGDHVHVVPLDAAPLIAAGRLDPALFDVTELLAAGYGDARRDDLPLIVTGAAPGLASGLAPGATVELALPALQIAAVRQPKASALAIAGLAPGGPRIWLDRIRQPRLDRSVPQIGGDVAHARGLTGAGITVAVLDTGVDASHPDFAGRLAAAEDFTGDGAGVGDIVGHGTHVASIIAGSGAASGGALAGVAPAARLISGRVCSVAGCPDSAILAGMAWAALEQRAPIINLSLGGPDAPGVDPLEDAIDQLSAITGALFVVSAGNTPGTGTVESPASADAALAVGAIDRAGDLARFSSTGPRVGDRAVKPDVTAPGVAIVAARAAGVPPIGTPVGAAYQALSGTSMAAPHVAGAAALLLQQHPRWTGAALKAQLIASAAPAAGVGAFAQGAGRIDLDRGTRQDLHAEPVALSLGLAAFPHDDDPALVRGVRYHNAGAAPVTLALAASLIGPAGPGAIAVEPAAITVPAGGSADVTVTVHTDGALANGLYSGAVIATAGDVRVVTPIGVEREQETFPLTLRFTGLDGAPSVGLVFPSPRGPLPPVILVVGETTVRLPAGRYAFDGDVPGATLVRPRIDLPGEAVIDFDHRLARPVEVDVGDPGVALTSALLAYKDFATGRVAGKLGFGRTISGAQLGPDLPADEVVGWATATLGDDLFTPKNVYHLAHQERGHLPRGFEATLAAADFATVDAHLGGRADALALKGALPLVDAGALGLITSPIFNSDQYEGPVDRTERYFGPGFRWEQVYQEGGRLLADPSQIVTIAQQLAVRDYRPGQRLRERFLRAPFGPAFIALPGLDPFAAERDEAISTASRRGDVLTLLPAMASDAEPGHGGFSSFTQQHVALLRDGVPLVEIDGVTDGVFPVPPGAATYRFEQDTTRDPARFARSTRISAAWTFRSQHVAEDRRVSLALPTIRYTPALDDAGATTARVLVLPIAFPRPPGAPAPPIVRASLEVSFDDGARWTSVPLAVLGERAIAVIVHPRGSHEVSLRSRATDLAGNQQDQTIVRAYTVR